MMMCKIALLFILLIFFAFAHAIFGGEDAKIEDFPFMTSYQIEYWEHMCGAIILSPEWILTTASCAGWPYPGPRILAGSTDLSPENVKNNQTVHIDSFILHPLFNWNVIDSYDLGLVKLSKPLVFGDTVKAAVFASPDIELRNEVTFVGWGETNLTDWKRSPVLQSISLPILSTEDCMAGSGDTLDELETGYFYCTGPVRELEIGPCFKDKGGPIVQDGLIVGIYMYAERCAKNPSVYLKMGNFTDWIHETINAN